MALRKRGKAGLYHAYFRIVTTRPDGQLQYKLTTVNLGTSDLKTARALEQELLEKNRKARLHQRFLARMAVLENAAESGIDAPAIPASLPPLREHRHKRLKLSEWEQTAEKYKPVSETQRKIFKRFIREINLTYADEVTPELAYSYLNRRYGGEGKGKSFNNNKTALNAIYKVLLLDAGMRESPFDRLPTRRHTAKHQRPFSEEEFVRIYQAAKEPWKTAVLIAWYTGLREKDVFLLRWDQIKGDIITTLPGKTSRFGRSVQIPLHPQLQRALIELPHNGDRILGAWSYCPVSANFHRYFGELLNRLGINETPEGIVTFNSLRDSFVTRCDAAGIPRHAIRGIVGHVSDAQTDLYSHDLHTAKLIQTLPSVNLEQ